MPIRAADLVAEFRGDARHFERTSDQVQREILRLAGLDPEINVDADTGAARTQIADLGAQVSGLSALDPDINVDADTVLARTALGEVASLAEVLDASRPEVQVKADTSRARDEFGRFVAATKAIPSDVNVDVDADTAGALSKVAAIRVALTGLADHGKGASKTISGAFDKAFGDMVVRSRISFGAIALGFTGVTAAATVGLGAAGGFGLAIASGNEQAQISFETMLGSAEKASTFLTSLKDFAATTPFEFPELQTAASSLISAGVEANKVIPIMTSLGNATSGMGTGSEGVKRATVALQQMSAAGKITGEDLNQLRDAGIPVFDLLAAATGKSKEEVAGLAQAGKLGRTEMEQLFSALESGKGLERFNGLMEAQSQSLSGIMSTIKDTVGQGLATAVQPAIPVIKSALGDANDLFGEFANNIGGVFSDVITALAPTIEPLLDLVAALGVAFEPVIGVFAQVAGAVAGALAPALTAMAPALGEIAGQFGEFLVALVPLLPAIVELAAAALPLLQVLIPVATTIAEALVPALTTLMGWLEPMAPVIAAVVGVFAAAGPVIGAVAAVLGFILSPLGLVVAAIAAVIAIGAVLVNNWDTIKQVSGAVWGFIQDIIGTVAGWIRDRIGDIVGFVVGLVVKFNELRARVGEVVGNVIGFFGDLGRGIGDKIGQAIGFVKEIPRRILDALGNVGRILFDAGKSIIQGLIDGIKNMIGGVGRAIGSVAQTVRDFLPFSPAKRGPLSGRGAPNYAGMAISTMVTEGILRGLPDVAGAAGRLASATSFSVSPGLPSMAPPAIAAPASRSGPYYEVHFHGPVVGNQAGMRDLARKLAEVSGGRSRVGGLD